MELVQRIGTKGASELEDGTMPPYVSRRGGQYVFRQGVPHALRPVIGKREFKKALGSDYRTACAQAKVLAVEVEKIFSAARTYQSRHATTLAARALPKHELTAVSSQLRAELKSLWLSIVDAADVQRRAAAFACIGQDEIAAQNAEIVKLFRQALITGDVAPVLKPMHETLYLAGYVLSSDLYGTAAERELAIDYARAVLEGVKLIEARDVGDDMPLPVTPPLPHREQISSAAQSAVPVMLTGPAAGLPLHAPIPAHRPELGTDVMMLSEMIALFLEKWNRGEPMRLKLVTVLDLFLTVTGDKPISALRQMDVNNFFEFVQRLPPRWKDACRQRNCGVIELAAQEHEVTIGQKTFDDSYLAAMRIFLQSAITNWQDQGFPTTLTTKAIKYSGRMKGGRNKQRALTSDELRLVFEGDSLREFGQCEDTLHQFWLPVLGLHTGARVNELCQLNPMVDIYYVDGILVLDITDESEAAEGIVKSVKNIPSCRLIPVHKNLLALGFDQYVEVLQKAGAKQLFPQWAPYRGKASANAGKWHARWLQQQGVNAVERPDGRKVRGAHAYRHTLLTYGRVAGLMLWGVSGHASTIEGNTNVVALGYEDPDIVTSLATKKATLDALEYQVKISPPIKLSLESARRIVAEAADSARAGSKKKSLS